MNSIYERTVTSLEAEQGYIFILKNKRSFFPEEGSPFSITYGLKKKKVKIESYHCECQGPDKPHEHYFVRWSGLAKGDHLIIKKLASDQQLYSFRVEENL